MRTIGKGRSSLPRSQHDNRSAGGWNGRAAGQRNVTLQRTQARRRLQPDQHGNVGNGSLSCRAASMTTYSAGSTPSADWKRESGGTPATAGSLHRQESTRPADTLAIGEGTCRTDSGAAHQFSLAKFHDCNPPSPPLIGMKRPGKPLWEGIRPAGPPYVGQLFPA